jgi:hypothetical protein
MAKNLTSARKANRAARGGISCCFLFFLSFQLVNLLRESLCGTCINIITWREKAIRIFCHFEIVWESIVLDNTISLTTRRTPSGQVQDFRPRGVFTVGPSRLSLIFDGVCSLY